MRSKLLLLSILIGACSSDRDRSARSDLAALDDFGGTDESERAPLPPEGSFVPTYAGTLSCPPGGAIQLAQVPHLGMDRDPVPTAQRVACAIADGGPPGPGCEGACTACDEASIEQAVDEFLADPAFAGGDAPFTAETSQEDALKKCFTIAQYVKWKENVFDCKHFAYYTKACLKRFFPSVWTAAIWCKDCTNPDYKNGKIGHDVIGYYSSELGKCCMAEPSSKYPDAAIVCQNAASAAMCDWKQLLADANTKYCAGTWFGDAMRKKDCVVDTSRGGWHENAYTCDAATQKCLRDNDITPPAQCVGSYRCENGQWSIKSVDARQCTGTASCIGPLPVTNGPCATAGAATTFTAPCP